MLLNCRAALLCGGALVASLVASLSLAHLESEATASPTTTPIDAKTTPPWPDIVPLDLAKSDPHMVLVDAFQVAGIGENEATEKVDEIFDDVFGSGDEPRLDWQRSSPHLVIYDAFVAADYSREDALAFASMAMRTFQGKSAVPNGEALLNLQEYHVYRLTITWSDDNGEQRQIRRYVGKNSWDNFISDSGLTDARCGVGKTVVYTASLAEDSTHSMPGHIRIHRGWNTWVDVDSVDMLSSEFLEACDNAGFTCSDVLNR